MGGFCAVALEDMSDDITIDLNETEIEQGSTTTDGDKNNSANLGVLTSGAFIPFVSLISTVSYPEPINMIFSFVVVLISSVQLLILILMALNLLPFFNT